MQENIFYLNNFLENRKADSVIFFPAGLIGLELCHNFLARPAKFGKLSNDCRCIWLENVELDSVRLLTIEPEGETKFTKQQDVQEIASHLGVEKESLSFIYIVTVGESGCTINTCAPLVIDYASKCGRQFILDGSYSTKQELKDEETW